MEVLHNVTSPRARRLIKNCCERARGWPVFEILWEQVFSPTERRMLGYTVASDAFQKYGVPKAWQKLRGQQGPRAAVEIMFALGGLDRSLYQWLLGELGEIESWNTQVEAAVASGALVLVEGQMEAFWDGREIPCDWSKHLSRWIFLITIAQAAKRGDVLDRLSLGAAQSETTLKHRKSNLLRLPFFPTSLADLIRSEGHGSYRLHLESEQIRIFEQVGTDDYRELVW